MAVGAGASMVVAFPGRVSRVMEYGGKVTALRSARSGCGWAGWSVSNRRTVAGPLGWKPLTVTGRVTGLGDRLLTRRVRLSPLRPA